MQLIQNTAARLVTRTKVSSHISPVLHELHWLPVKFRLQYKLLLLAYRAVNGPAPSYISELLDYYQPSRSGLRSENKNLLDEKMSSRSWGDRAFAVAAPRLWNTLPDDIRACSSLESFKTALKTHLMDLANK